MRPHPILRRTSSPSDVVALPLIRRRGGLISSTTFPAQRPAKCSAEPCGSAIGSGEGSRSDPSLERAPTKLSASSPPRRQMRQLVDSGDRGERHPPPPSSSSRGYMGG